jgi:hypothetical protein
MKQQEDDRKYFEKSLYILQQQEKSLEHAVSAIPLLDSRLLSLERNLHDNEQKNEENLMKIHSILQFQQKQFDELSTFCEESLVSRCDSFHSSINQLKYDMETMKQEATSFQSSIEKKIQEEITSLSSSTSSSLQLLESSFDSKLSLLEKTVQSNQLDSLSLIKQHYLSLTNDFQNMSSSVSEEITSFRSELLNFLIEKTEQSHKSLEEKIEDLTLLQSEQLSSLHSLEEEIIVYYEKNDFFKTQLMESQQRMELSFEHFTNLHEQQVTFLYEQFKTVKKKLRTVGSGSGGASTRSSGGRGGGGAGSGRRSCSESEGDDEDISVKRLFSRSKSYDNSSSVGGRTATSSRSQYSAANATKGSVSSVFTTSKGVGVPSSVGRVPSTYSFDDNASLGGKSGISSLGGSMISSVASGILERRKSREAILERLKSRSRDPQDDQSRDDEDRREEEVRTIWSRRSAADGAGGSIRERDGNEQGSVKTSSQQSLMTMGSPLSLDEFYDEETNRQEEFDYEAGQQQQEERSHRSEKTNRTRASTKKIQEEEDAEVNQDQDQDDALRKTGSFMIHSDSEIPYRPTSSSPAATAAVSFPHSLKKTSSFLSKTKKFKKIPSTVSFDLSALPSRMTARSGSVSATSSVGSKTNRSKGSSRSSKKTHPNTSSSRFSSLSTISSHTNFGDGHQEDRAIIPENVEVELEERSSRSSRHSGSVRSGSGGDGNRTIHTENDTDLLSSQRSSHRGGASVATSSSVLVSLSSDDILSSLDNYSQEMAKYLHSQIKNHKGGILSSLFLL